jgi:hypothetical protein
MKIKNDFSFSETEKELRRLIENAKGDINIFVRDEFNADKNFKKTSRDGKEIKLTTSLGIYDTTKDTMEFSIEGIKGDILLLKEDEVGIGSKGIRPKASVLKLKNSLRFYAKSLGGEERT